jgi:hydroxymethylbilane synthase
VAGLRRLGLTNAWATSEFSALSVTPIPFEQMLPAPGQAVLVLETREDDAATRGLVQGFDHPHTRVCATAERAFLRAFGGGCSMPIAALGAIESNQLTVTGLIASPDGSEVLKDKIVGSPADPEGLAAELAEKLNREGAQDLLKGLEVVR